MELSTHSRLASPVPPRPRVAAASIISLLLLIPMAMHSGSAAAQTVSPTRPSGNQSLASGTPFTVLGLFPVHIGQQDRGCAPAINVQGLQGVEAMFYALDRVNARWADFSLRPTLVDTCGDHARALEGLVEYYFDNKDSSNRMIAVIGALYNSVSQATAEIMQTFRIPQISYASTSMELSDKSRFEYFSRVVPPDTYQAQAIVEVVKAFGWTYVSTLADEGNYGEKGIHAFEKLAEESGICIAESLKLPREIAPNTFTSIVNKLLANPKARVVVLFVNEDSCRKLIQATVRMELADTFYWLASDSWGAKSVPVHDQEWAAEGAVTILPQREVLRDFDDYFMSLNPGNNERNPWFREFWESHFDCSFDTGGHTPICTGRERVTKPKYQQEGVVPFVVDAVYAMAHALHNLIAAECRDGRLCPSANPPAGPLLLQYIRNVSFTGAAGHTVKFNEDGDAMGRYTIYQYQKDDDGSYDYVPIGTWSDSFFINLTMTRWKNNSLAMPRSVCSEPCASGHIMQKNEALDSCCWVCIQCQPHEILKDENTCEACRNGTFPNPNKTHCHDLPIQYLTMDSPWAIVPVVFASVGILLTLFIFAVFLKYNRTPVIMASGRELCFVLMGGLLMSYTMTFIMVARPSFVSCCFMRIGLGLSLSICFASMFTKTNRISRIFNRGVKAMVKRPSYTSPRSQLVICFCLVSVQIIGAITWVGMDLPDVALVYPDPRTVVLRCKSTNVAVVVSLLYNMVLIIMCTVYAFKTRKIPENFNEAKYIAFTMYSTCIVWLALIPIYFGTNMSDFRIQITTLCMCVSISATVILGCLFVPKVYIVLFQPHKNVRQGAKGTGPRPFFGRQSGRFTSLAAMNGDITSPSNFETDMTLMTSAHECGDLQDEVTCTTPLSTSREQETGHVGRSPTGASDDTTNGGHQTGRGVTTNGSHQSGGDQYSFVPRNNLSETLPEVARTDEEIELHATSQD